MESTHGLQIGQIVISKAGRDSGRKFIVLEVLDDKHVLLVDGNLRRVEQGKKKKVKHLAKTNLTSSFLQRKVQAQERITNAMIRKELEQLSADE